MYVILYEVVSPIHKKILIEKFTAIMLLFKGSERVEQWKYAFLCLGKRTIIKL